MDLANPLIKVHQFYLKITSIYKGSPSIQNLVFIQKKWSKLVYLLSMLWTG